jgi:hypothetical protein
MPGRVGENLPDQLFNGSGSQTDVRHFDWSCGDDKVRSLARVQSRGIAVHFDQRLKEQTYAPGCDRFLLPSVADRLVLASDQVERHAQKMCGNGRTRPKPHFSPESGLGRGASSTIFACRDHFGAVLPVG